MALRPSDVVVGETYRVVANAGYFDKVMRLAKIDSSDGLMHFRCSDGYPYFINPYQVDSHSATIVKWQNGLEITHNKV